MTAPAPAPALRAPPPPPPSAEQQLCSDLQQLVVAAAIQRDALPAGTYRMFDAAWKFVGIECDKALRDQCDFTVVGVAGQTGCGKSTVLSHFAFDYAQRNRTVFPTASRESLVLAQPHTCGVHLHVTAERVVLLDTAPVLAMSVTV